MAAKTTILNKLKRLEHARQTSIPIVIETQQRSIKQLMDSFIATKQVMKIKNYKNSTLVKVTPRVKSIETLPQTVKVKKDEMTQWSTKLLEKTKKDM